MILELPWPPSVNTYWRHVVMGKRKATLLSAKGREYKRAVGTICQMMRVKPLDGPLWATLDLYPPTNARRDCDNFCKAVLDACEGRLYGDDSQIIDLHIRMHQKSPPGLCRVSVGPVGDA